MSEKTAEHAVALPPEVRERLLKATRGTALAFVEDLAHIRDILEKHYTDRGDIRRLSNILRRLLIDAGGDLGKIAPPRIGRIYISIPTDEGPFAPGSYAFFASGGGTVHGFKCCAISIIPEGSSRNADGQPHDHRSLVSNDHTAKDLRGHAPAERHSEYSLDQFLAHDVLLWSGKVINRRDTIKYVANVAHGTHSGAPKEESEIILADIARRFTYTVSDGKAGKTMRVNFNVSADVDTENFNFDKNNVNAVLFELLSAAHYLCSSPAIEALEEKIKAELSGSASTNNG